MSVAALDAAHLSGPAVSAAQAEAVALALAASERTERTNASFVVVLTLMSTALALYDAVLLMSGL